jgi:hypothetical protein
MCAFVECELYLQSCYKNQAKNNKEVLLEVQKAQKKGNRHSELESPSLSCSSGTFLSNSHVKAWLLTFPYKRFPSL